SVGGTLTIYPSTPGNRVSLAAGTLAAAAVVNNSTFTQTGGTFSAGAFTNNAMLVLRGGASVTSTFGRLVNGPAAVIQAGSNVLLDVGGDFRSSSTQSTSWDTRSATLRLGAGGGTTAAHLVDMTGGDFGGNTLAGYDNNFAWGALAVDPGQMITLTD